MFEIPSRPEWMLQAACRVIEPSEVMRFFPTSGGSVSAAREFCERCDVKSECAQFAIDNRVHHGVWGGLSERDRRRARIMSNTHDVSITGDVEQERRSA